MVINATNRSRRYRVLSNGTRVDAARNTQLVSFFSDGFETGNLSYTQGGASWGASAASSDGSSVTLVSGAGNPGYGLVFSYAGEADLAQTSRCEQFFDLGALYTEVTIEFDLYIPAGTESYGGSAYVHRDSTDSDNNKFIRLWHTTESVDEEKVGASLFRVTGDYSDINAEWGAAMGVNGQPSASFIRASDLGTWINVRFYAKAPSAAANGTIKIWRNGVLIIDRTALVDSYNASELHAYRYGYLLGTANSGFTDTTKFVIDNVKFYVGEA